MASQLALTESGRYKAALPSTPAFTVSQVEVELPAKGLLLPVLSDATSAAAASYRSLAYRLRRESDPRVIAVTSAAPKEGKTSCAVNLAAALAEREQSRVLLVEANRLRARLASTFGIEVPACFEAQLSSALPTDRPEWWVVAVVYDNLHLLAADPDRASGRAVSPRMYRLLLEQARGTYSHVIIDCPAVSDGGDLGIVEDLSDGVLMTALGGKTKRRALCAAVDRLAPASLLGVVLLGAEV
jgi:Mrp family chromosome partitioning ATPase